MQAKADYREALHQASDGSGPQTTLCPIGIVAAKSWSQDSKNVASKYDRPGCISCLLCAMDLLRKVPQVNDVHIQDLHTCYIAA